MITVTAPNPAIDRLLRVDRLTPGMIHRPEPPIAVPGGKGLNVARVAHALGADVNVVGLAAGAAGRWIAQRLDDTGIAGQWVWTPGESRICTSVADATTTELTEFYEPGPPMDAAAWERYVDLVTRLAHPDHWMVISGSLPPGVGDTQVLDLLQAHRGSTAVDTSGDALKVAASWSMTGLVKLNHHEVRELLDGTVARYPDTSLPSLAAELSRHVAGMATVVVTGGVDGSVMVEREGRMLWARLAVVGPYPVGSGDAFLAGLLTARDEGQTWSSALRLATAAAAANAETPGPGVLDAGRVKSLRALVEVEEVAPHHG